MILLGIAVLYLVVAVGVEYIPETFSIFTFLVTILISMVTFIGLIFAINNILEGNPVSIKESYKIGFKKILPYLWISVLVCLATFGGFLLLIIPGIIFAIWFLFAPYVLIIKDTRGISTLAISRQLVKGNWWYVLGAPLVCGIVYGICIYAPFGILHVLLTFGLKFPDDLYVLVFQISSGLEMIALIVVYVLMFRNLMAIKGADIVCSPPKKATKIAVVIGVSVTCLIFIIAIFPRKPYESPLLKEAHALRAKLEVEIQSKPNAADDYFKAMDVYIRFSSKKEKELSRQHDDVFKNGWIEENKELREYLRKNQNALQYLDSGIKKKLCLLPRTDKFDQLLPELAVCRGFARLKIIKGKLYESQGQYEMAMNEYLGVMKLGKDVAIGEALIHKLVSIAIESVGLRRVREIAQKSDVLDNTLKEAVARINDIKSHEFKIADTYKMEFISVVSMIDMVYREGYMKTKGIKNIKKVVPMRQINRWPMKHDNTLKLFDRFHRDLIKKVNSPYPESVKVDLNKYLYEAEKGNFGFFWLLKNIDNPIGKLLLSMLLPALERANESAVRSEAEANLTITILAIELYKREKGQYPKNIDGLVPEYLQVIPEDPFTTKSLIYKKDNDKYILYSCGVDMDDDGGKTIYTYKIPEDRNGDLMF
ncbi:EI24 domain-containing protein [candidate division WOR-3 bacterium]|nr:EI24 domain-containing protein [candidate division WOR-3 bacterium]